MTSVQLEFEGEGGDSQEIGTSGLGRLSLRSFATLAYFLKI